MNKELRAKIHNKFEIEVIDAKTGRVKEKAQAFNVICNQLWSCLIASSSVNYARFIHYGSGTGTPATSDTSLFTFAGYKEATSAGGSADYTNGVISSIRYIQLAASEAVDTTISEIGLAYGTASSNLVTHAMLQDMNGNPISIHKTDTDIINIYSTMYLHYNVNSSDFELCRGGLTNALLGVSTTDLNGLQICVATSNSVIYSSYNGAIASGTASKNADLANKRLVYTAPRFPVGTGNTTSAKYLCLNSALSGLMVKSSQNTWQTHIANEVVGTGDGSTTKFKTKFSFPENAIVKINGNALSSGVTVKKLPVYTTYWQYGDSGSATKVTFLGIAPESTDSKHIYVPATASKYYNVNSWNLADVILYNPLWQEGEGLYGLYPDNFGIGTRIDVSNDLINWTTALTLSSSYSLLVIPQQYRASKYFKFVGRVSGNERVCCFQAFQQTQDGYNIVFDTAPVSGDVITIDYDTESIAKDSDHVLDVTLTMTFEEWSGE